MLQHRHFIRSDGAVVAKQGIREGIDNLNVKIAARCAPHLPASWPAALAGGKNRLLLPHRRPAYSCFCEAGSANGSQNAAERPAAVALARALTACATKEMTCRYIGQGCSSLYCRSKTLPATPPQAERHRNAAL